MYITDADATGGLYRVSHPPLTLAQACPDKQPRHALLGPPDQPTTVGAEPDVVKPFAIGNTRAVFRDAVVHGPDPNAVVAAACRGDVRPERLPGDLLSQLAARDTGKR
jgi:hypothetical protein